MGTSTINLPRTRQPILALFGKNKPAWAVGVLSLILAVLIGVFGGPSQLVATLVTGGMWALMSVGLALVFGVMNIPHFAHGESFMVGAYVAYFVFTPLHDYLEQHPSAFLSAIAPFAGMIVAAVVGGVLGVLLEKLIFYPLRQRTKEGWVMNAFLLTVGISFVLTNGALLTLGAELPRRAPVLGCRPAQVPRRPARRRPPGRLRRGARRHRRLLGLPAAHPHRPRHPRRLAG